MDGKRLVRKFPLIECTCKKNIINVNWDVCLCDHNLYLTPSEYHEKQLKNLGLSGLFK